jgi:hypothetical protein
MHTAQNIRTVYEEIERASAKLYKRIRTHDNPIITALGNYDTNMHYTYKRPKQILQ